MWQATLLWFLRQRLLQPFASDFTRPVYRRFVKWITALIVNVEEHTITRSVRALDRVADRKARETFAEYGAWRADAATSNLGPARRGGPRPPLARLPRLGRR
jgi:hypothetical protein